MFSNICLFVLYHSDNVSYHKQCENTNSTQYVMNTSQNLMNHKKRNLFPTADQFID